MPETKSMSSFDSDEKAKKAAADKAAAEKEAADKAAAKPVKAGAKPAEPEETPAPPSPTQAEADAMKEAARGQTREASAGAEGADYKTR